MLYYKTPLPGPITILCAGLIEGAGAYLGRSRLGEAVYESPRLTSDAPNTRTEGKLIYQLSLLLAATHRAEFMGDKVKMSPIFNIRWYRWLFTLPLCMTHLAGKVSD